MRTSAHTDKKQRKHDMLLTFLSAAYAGRRKMVKKRNPVNIRSTILLLLGTV